MATCQMMDCPNKNKDVAVGRFVMAPDGAVVYGLYCLSCSLRILSGKKFPAENEGDVVRCRHDNGVCAGYLWQCQTCREWFCQAHGHKGRNVECAACERKRKEEEERWQPR